MKRFVMFNMEKMELGEMFCRNQAPLVVPDRCILYQLVEVTALNSAERRKTVKANTPVQQPKHAIIKRAKCLHYNTTVDGSLCNDCHKKLR